VKDHRPADNHHFGSLSSGRKPDKPVHLTLGDRKNSLSAVAIEPVDAVRKQRYKTGCTNF